MMRTETLSFYPFLWLTQRKKREHYTFSSTRRKKNNIVMRIFNNQMNEYFVFIHSKSFIFLLPVMPYRPAPPPPAPPWSTPLLQTHAHPPPPPPHGPGNFNHASHANDQGLMSIPFCCKAFFPISITQFNIFSHITNNMNRQWFYIRQFFNADNLLGTC